MADQIYIYIVHLPYGIKEAVSPCFDGYTVYISENLSTQGRYRAYRHALEHIRNGDFAKQNVQQIEEEAHGQIQNNQD